MLMAAAADFLVVLTEEPIPEAEVVEKAVAKDHIDPQVMAEVA